MSLYPRVYVYREHFFFKSKIQGRTITSSCVSSFGNKEVNSPTLGSGNVALLRE